MTYPGITAVWVSASHCQGRVVAHGGRGDCLYREGNPGVSGTGSSPRKVGPDHAVAVSTAASQEPAEGSLSRLPPLRRRGGH